jgi:hypothetical protein
MDTSRSAGIYPNRKSAEFAGTMLDVYNGFEV